MESPVPEWLALLLGSIGVALAAFVSRMGWNAGAKPAPEDKAELAAGIIDSKAAYQVAAALEGLTFTVKEAEAKAKDVNRDWQRILDEGFDALKDHTRAVEGLTVELREHRAELSRRRG